jgi:hydrogenase maturation factor
MSAAPPVFTARLVELREGPCGRVGRASVRGARADVILDLVPEAKAGDAVLVHAGVALALVRDEPDGVEWDGRVGRPGGIGHVPGGAGKGRRDRG